MRHLSIVLLFVVAALLSFDSFAQMSHIEGMKNQIEQARKEVMAKMPKVPQVPKVPRIKRTSLLKREFSSPVLDDILPKSLQTGLKYRTAFESLKKSNAATGYDYLQLYFTMSCDEKYDPTLSELRIEEVADKYLEIEKPCPERLAEDLEIAKRLFPNQRLIGATVQTPSNLLIKRATIRYYNQVLSADSTFIDEDAAFLSQIYEEYQPNMDNQGSILYYYLTGLYEYAIPPLERYYKTFEDYPTSDRYINRHIDEIVPKFKILERCYEAIGYTALRDTLIARPTYQRIIKPEVRPEASR